MRILNLGSGSKGNSTYIEYNDTAILLDCGINITRVMDTLRRYNITRHIDGILITHEHSDHIKHLVRYMNRFQTNVYITKESFDNLPNYIYDYIDMNRIFFIEKEKKYKIKDMIFVALQLYHDTKDTVGYLIKMGNKNYSYMTDTGILPDKYLPLLQKMNYIMIESNHDVEMLLNSDRDYTLKQRILSDHGHLSNDQCAEILEKVVNEKTKVIMLSHLSEECNQVDIAYNTSKKVLNNKNSSTKLLVLNQHTETLVEDND